MSKSHVTFRMDDDLIKKVEEDAKVQKRTRTFILEEIVLAHYARNGKKPTTPTKKKAGAR